MRLIKARVQNYRSIIDTGEFEIEKLKTIMVGPNEAGKTVLLMALQQLNTPTGISGFNYLRDYPRSLLSDITTGEKKIEDITVVTGYYELEDADKADIPKEFHECIYKSYTNIDNKSYYCLENAPDKVTYRDIKGDLLRLLAHLDKQHEDHSSGDSDNPSTKIKLIIDSVEEASPLTDIKIRELETFLDKHYTLIDESNDKEEQRYNSLLEKIKFNITFDEVLDKILKREPVYVLFSNYFKVKPSIHLEHLAERTEKNLLDDDSYDYGNLCLLKLLGFSARELSNIGKILSPKENDKEALKAYKEQLDGRTYRLNSASVKLTKEVLKIWNPDPKRSEANKLRLSADGQYLKVVVEDEMGVEIELDQRSEGFQWLVSFFIVFFAEAKDKHKNAILLLDEPGMSLHGLKQRDFRDTISRLAEHNQVLYTTHSPFLVGPNELDIVRVVELKDRKVGTKVHTTLSSSDPAGLLPLQEALGYDLAQSLFSQERNLILEGLTDYWYIDCTAQLLSNGSIISINEKIALVFANSAGKVVYYATILHAHSLKVAALLDSDVAGDQAAKQENLVHTLGVKKILRTKDYVSGVNKAEIEDLLRETLIEIVKHEFDKDVSKIASSQLNRPIVEIFANEVPGFSKYKLAKAYVRWTRNNEANSLTDDERSNWKALIEQINNVLK